MLWVLNYISEFFLSLFARGRTGSLRSATLSDGLRIILATTFFAFAQRTVNSAFKVFTDGLSVTAEIHAPDEIYYWIEAYLLKHSSVSNISLDLDKQSSPDLGQKEDNEGERGDDDYWYIFKYIWETIWPTGKTIPRTLTISSKRTKTHLDAQKKRVLKRRLGDMTEKEVDEGRKIRINIRPSLDVVQRVQFGNRIIQVKTQNTDSRSRLMDEEKRTLIISSFLGTPTTLMSFIRTAKDEYYVNSSSYVSIYSAHMRSYACEWIKGPTRNIRPWESVILPTGVKESLLKDCQDFLDEHDFYLKRGVPHRRGYLLALAAKLKLDIHIVSLGTRGMDDDKLNSLLQDCPDKCLLLMEDIDCAFKSRSVSRPAEETSNLPIPENMEHEQPKSNGTTIVKRKKMSSSHTAPDHSSTGITLSGLLNAIDGVGSSEGRLLFCTTNWKEHIDEALSRPGRCDVWVEFRYATQQQARELFVYFYSARHLSDGIQKSPKDLVEVKINGHVDQTESEELQTMGKRFASAIPDYTVSVSALQGYLMRYKRDPVTAVEEVQDWVLGGCSQSPSIAIGNGAVQNQSISVNRLANGDGSINGDAILQEEA
uniref:BCS1 N-terminal domain-containing protein n=1 Tax=Kwoniella dejecticola CBS 10117 TaxID=1296121 RepID=A0A1A6A1Q7_9TREE|nr:uncharacterized protein I303_06262 [Kwoniella dejecticola CBS 10117]OBR83975.1 hypothetical protein I303_06262 [Kwoniella dejecticola CBS 10117]